MIVVVVYDFSGTRKQVSNSAAESPWTPFGWECITHSMEHRLSLVSLPLRCLLGKWSFLLEGLLSFSRRIIMLSVMVFTSVRLLSIFGTFLYHFRFDADVGVVLLCSFGLHHVVSSLQFSILCIRCMCTSETES